MTRLRLTAGEAGTAVSQQDGRGPMTRDQGAALRSSRGFTLVELVVVVTLIVLLAVVSAVNVLRSRMTGNETVALSNLRQLAVAVRAYHSVNNIYPDPLGLLSDVQPPYAPVSLTGGSGANGAAGVAGYAYEYDREGDGDYQLIARPVTDGVTGTRRFFVDETGVLRYTADGTDPTADSSVLK